MTDNGNNLESGSATSNQAASLERAFAEALAHYQQGRLHEAESGLLEILRLQPSLPDVLHLLALIELKTKRPGEAVRHLEKAVTAAPESAELFNLLGNGLGQEGRLVDAVPAYRRAVSLDPGLTEAHYNLGNALKKLDRWDKAIHCYRQAVSLKPNFVDAWYNLGHTLKAMDRFEDAITAYRHLLEINPNDVDSLNNLGNLLIATRQHDDAEKAFRRALEINPDSWETCFNFGTMLDETWRIKEAETEVRRALTLNPSQTKLNVFLGNILMKQGKLDDALEHLLMAVELKSDDPSAWFTLGIALKAKMDGKVGSREDTATYIEKIRSLAPLSPEPNLLVYWLDSFSPATAESSFDKAVQTLPPMEEESIRFTGSTRSPTPKRGAVKTPKRAVALLQWGRAGTGLLHSLMDYHSQITTIPGYYMTGFFSSGEWEKIAAPEREELVRRILRLYDVLFDASSPKCIPGYWLVNERSMGIMEGFTAMGENKDKTLCVNRKLFAQHLTGLLEEHEKIDRGELFKLIHVAFEQTLGRHADNDLIFYHIHNPDRFGLLNYLRHFPQSKLVMMIRDPLQNCESWLTSGAFQKRNYEGFVIQLIEFLFKFDQVIFKKYDSRAIRLEDIKSDPSKPMKLLCEWLEIKEEESLYIPTMQGLKSWGDPTTVRFGRTEPVFGFLKNASDPNMDPIKRKIGHLFSDRDQLILGTLFYPARVRYGYAEKDDERLESDLMTIRPMLEEPLDFEKKIIDDRLPSGFDFKSNSYYRLLRASLKDRWATLDAQGSYTNMIPPLCEGQVG